MRTTIPTLLITGAMLFGAAPAAARFHGNVSRTMAAAANPKWGYGSRLRLVRSVLAQPAKSVPKGTRLTALLVERSLMRGLINEGGDSRMHGFMANSIPDAVTAYGKGPFTKANRVHRQAADLFNRCATYQIKHLDAYAKGAMKGDPQGLDPVKYLREGMTKMQRYLGSPVAKAQGQEWNTWAQAQMKQVQGYVDNGSLRSQPSPRANQARSRRLSVNPWLAMWGL